MRISAHTVCTAVRDDIVSGAFPPGTRLTEELLARRYGVSRVPVREALRTLESEGFVTTRRNAGACVARLSEHEAADLLDIRAQLEPLGAARAAHRRSEAHLKVLRGLVRLGRERTQLGHTAELRPLGNWFHETLAQASGSPTFAALLVQLRRKVTWLYAAESAYGGEPVERAAAVWREHAAIVDAVARQDAEAARALAAAHVERGDALRRARRAVVVRTAKPVVNTARGPV
ncbi:GntR family transcriptional regulator [Streptomyces sp. JJ66]|uniref:GntR family transcriptional regulator n=1 Tax=Streptomyces sp. JJ66 TaxID=2803843 RepID=UPI001C559E8B|nr:GntR family transcriptional regulator [Streptomyces sp. JJ66]MBW1600814.1 GntR family transcriptional regulator [Streptomyces sp. JJ66]